MQNNITIDGFKISTWSSDGVEQPYMAVNMTEATIQLKGYDLSDKEKESIPELMAGYCRLIEERGLTGYGETEFQSIADLFSNARLVSKDKE